jgi:Uma2 family endonuclease
MTVAVPNNARPGRGASPMEEALARVSVVPLTVDQYVRMIEQGILSEDGGVELLRGVLVRKDRSVIGEDPMGHSPLHRLIVALLTKLAARIDSESRHVQVQLPVICSPDSAPEPDGAIVRGTPRDYAARLPTGADVSCVIEAAHSSLNRDQKDKLPIYAATGVPQYVIINLQNSTLEVYSDPDPAGKQYRTRVTVERGGAVELRLPEGAFTVGAAELLP